MKMHIEAVLKRTGKLRTMVEYNDLQDVYKRQDQREIVYSFKWRMPYVSYGTRYSDHGCDSL